MRTRISLILPLICAPLAFWGCGGDGSSTKADNEKSDIIASTYDDLPVCSGKREGATAYIKDEKTAYICEDGTWVEDGEDSGSNDESKNESSSSSKVKSSSSEKTDSSSSSAPSNEEESSDSADSDVKSSSSDMAETSSSSIEKEQPEIIKVKDKSVAGMSQKGPFVTGSAVKLYELDGGTYAQTGKCFTSKITSDKGEFTVSRVTLANQYALLETTGYYRNEVTGKKSSGVITLNALTDLSNREKVNINLLTHLEYERFLYLVGTGINEPTAKKQAETEIFNAFGIQGDFANSEDLNVFGEGDGNAALLALSLLMQGERSEAELTELLTKFATDIEKDGEWNDEATKTKIADWAMGQDLGGGLRIIRSNINGWDLGAAPDFEKYVRNFWYSNYGLGTCDDNSKGEVKAVANERAKNYGSKDRYICKSGAWVYARNIEKDTYEWSAGDDGELKQGDVNSDIWYKYDESLDKWVNADSYDTELGLKVCTVNRTGEVGELSETYYVCKNSKWQKAAEIEYDTYGKKCTNAEIGSMINGVVTETNKYYCSAIGWVNLMGGWSWVVAKEARLNPNVEYGAMTDARDGQTYKTVTIGTQTWMAENLNYADSVKTPSLKGQSWCYDNDPEKCAVTGRLYTWAAAIDSVALANDVDNPQTCGYGKTCDRLTDDALAANPIQGVCPNGWHLPSYAEWNTLIDSEEIGGANTAGAKLKSTSGWFSNGNGTDANGFSALPTGYRDRDGNFLGDGVDFYSWSASQSEHSSDGARIMGLFYSHDEADQSYYYKDLGFSIRCIKN